MNIFTKLQCQKIGEAIDSFYRKEARDLPWRRDPSFYSVWLCEIMAQQTKLEVVLSYHKKFMEELPTIKDLADVEEEKLLKLWEGLGYYNRARNLKRAAQEIVYRRKVVPKNYEDLLSLPGIGPYTAAAIASIAYGQPYVALDGNLSRVFSRLLCYEGDIGKAKSKRDLTAFGQDIMGKDPSAFNQGLMDIGARICLPKNRALCSSCPLQEFCLAFKRDLVENYPVKAKKAKRKLINRTIFILMDKDRLGLRKRPNNGLLRGQWELPGLDRFLNEREAEDFLRSQNFSFSSIEVGPSYKHIFSHIEWRMQSYFVSLKDLPMVREDDRLVYVSQEEIEKTYALPSAFKVFIEEWKKRNG